MQTPLQNAIEQLARKAEQAPTSHDAMHFTQAALNLAHAAVALHNTQS